jgi:hypothetical protein
MYTIIERATKNIRMPIRALNIMKTTIDTITIGISNNINENNAIEYEARIGRMKIATGINNAAAITIRIICKSTVIY